MMPDREQLASWSGSFSNGLRQRCAEVHVARYPNLSTNAAELRVCPRRSEALLVRLAMSDQRAP